jgi:hypothetical protein
MIDIRTDATPRGAYRSFTAHDGRCWLVWHISELTVEGLRDAGWSDRAWLVFLGPTGETRRLAPVPDRWRRFTDAELYTLVEAATPFTGRTD